MTDSPPPRSALARIIEQEMKRAGYTKHSLAVAAGLKIGFVQDILRDKSLDPGVAKIYAIGQVLGRTVGELLGREPLAALPKASGSDKPGQLVDDPDELTLIAFWRMMDDAERGETLSAIRNRFLER